MKIAKLLNYLEMAYVVAKRSHDTKTKVGAVLVHKLDGAVLSTGYNGYVRGAPDDELPNGDDDLKHQYMRHAEENMISNAAKHGVCVADGIVVVTLSPCARCLRFLWNCGVDTIYFPKFHLYKDLSASCRMGDLNVEVTEMQELTELKLTAKRPCL